MDPLPSHQLPVAGSPRFDSEVVQQIVTSDDNAGYNDVAAGSLDMDLEYGGATEDSRQRMYPVDSIHCLSSMCPTRFRLGH